MNTEEKVGDKKSEIIRDETQKTDMHRTVVGDRLDSWIVLGGTGLVGVSAGFLQITEFEVVYSWLLYLSWFFIGFAVLIVLLMTYKVFEYSTARVQAGVLLLSDVVLTKEQGEKIGRHLTTDTTKMHYLEEKQYHLVFPILVVGILLFAIFACLNVSNRNEMIKETNRVKAIQNELQIEKLRKEIEILDIQAQSKY